VATPSRSPQQLPDARHARPTPVVTPASRGSSSVEESALYGSRGRLTEADTVVRNTTPVYVPSASTISHEQNTVEEYNPAILQSSFDTMSSVCQRLRNFQSPLC